MWNTAQKPGRGRRVAAKLGAEGAEAGCIGEGQGRGCWSQVWAIVSVEPEERELEGPGERSSARLRKGLKWQAPGDLGSSFGGPTEQMGVLSLFLCGRVHVQTSHSHRSGAASYCSDSTFLRSITTL